MKSLSESESWCQSVGVRAKGGLARGKGRAFTSGFERHWAWKREGNDDSSMTTTVLSWVIFFLADGIGWLVGWKQIILWGIGSGNSSVACKFVYAYDDDDDDDGNV